MTQIFVTLAVPSETFDVLIKHKRYYLFFYLHAIVVAQTFHEMNQLLLTLREFWGNVTDSYPFIFSSLCRVFNQYYLRLT